MYDIIMVHDSSNLQLLGRKTSDTTRESLMGNSLEQLLKHSANSQPGDKIYGVCSDNWKLLVKSVKIEIRGIERESGTT